MEKETLNQQAGLPEKKAYERPRLVEYGSIAKLTQGGGVSGTDVNTMMGACL
jgi:hypothetical protein